MNKSFGTPGLERNALAKGKHLEDDHIALGVRKRNSPCVAKE